MTGRVVAFYGFKGGAGRSFLMANMAALLAANGNRVLIIDGDLEAPGLGDFFDVSSSVTSMKTGALSSEWRLKKGFLDLMEAVTSLAQKGTDRDEIASQIRAWLDPDVPSDRAGESGSDYLTQVGPYWPSGPTDQTAPDQGASQARGSLLLMGAGNHAATRDDGSYDFLRRILNFDWAASAQDRDGVAFGTLKEVLDGDLFDHVFIDGRTGYNAASIIAIQSIATDVVMVGTSSLQSIDGIARMRPLFSGRDPEQPELIVHLVISKMSGTQPEGPHLLRRTVANQYKRKLQEKYLHAGYRFYDFPFVRDFASGDSLMFARSVLKDIWTGVGTQPDDVHKNVHGYIEELLALTRAISGGRAGKFDRDEVTNAFEKWRRRDPSGLIRAFEVLSDETGIDERSERAARELAIGSVKLGVKEFLESGGKWDTPFQADSDGEFRLRTEADSLGFSLPATLLSRFAALHPEERLYVQVWARDLIEKNVGAYHHAARRSVTIALHLKALPNLVSRAQFEALGLSALRPAPQDSAEIDQAGKSVAVVEQRRNAANLERACAELMQVPDDERQRVIADFEEIRNATGHEAFHEVVEVLTGLAERDPRLAPKRGERLLKILKAENFYLPRDLRHLGRPNILDVAKASLGRQDVLATGAEARRRMADVAAEVLDFYCRTFTAAAEDPASGDVGQLVMDLGHWVEIRQAMAIFGSDLGDPHPPDLPTEDDMAGVAQIAAKVAAQTSRPVSNQLGALHLLSLIETMLDDADAANAQLEKAAALAERGQGDAEIDKQLEAARTEAQLGLLIRDAHNVKRGDLAWRFRRILEVHTILSGKRPGSDGFDLEAYVGSTLDANELGLPIWGPGRRFPVLPGQLVESAKRRVERDFGWFRDAAAAVAGNYCGLLQAEYQGLGDDGSEGDSNADGKLLWLAIAYSATGNVNRAASTLETWRLKVGSTRTQLADNVPGFVKAVESILGGLLAQGRVEEFDQFYDATLGYVPRILRMNLPGLGVRRRILHLMRHAPHNGDMPEAVLREARRLIDHVSEVAPKPAAPADAAYMRLAGQVDYVPSGSFSGRDAPTTLRASFAENVIDLMGLLPEPDEVMLARAEAMIWGLEIRARGEGDLPEPIRFLEPIAYALCLPRAKLECLRARFGLAADMDRARAEMEKDCAEPQMQEPEPQEVDVWSQVHGNGAGRRIYYPKELTGSVTAT